MCKPIRRNKGKVGYIRLRRKNINNVKYAEEKNHRNSNKTLDCEEKGILPRLFEHAVSMQPIIIQS